MIADAARRISGAAVTGLMGPAVAVPRKLRAAIVVAVLAVVALIIGFAALANS